MDVQADGWIDLYGARRYTLRGDSVKINEDPVLSLLWWRDESQLSNLTEEEDE